MNTEENFKDLNLVGFLQKAIDELEKATNNLNIP
jgi:hypothetical protein